MGSAIRAYDYFMVERYAEIPRCVTCGLPRLELGYWLCHQVTTAESQLRLHMQHCAEVYRRPVGEERAVKHRAMIAIRQTPTVVAISKNREYILSVCIVTCITNRSAEKMDSIHPSIAYAYILQKK